MISMLIALAKFMVILLVMALICSVGWELFTDKLYDCTDPGFVDFLSPGNWVHSWPRHPVLQVAKIVHGRSMSEPDAIKQGWSMTGLWCLWFSLVGVAFAISLFLSRKPWFASSSTLPESRRSPGLWLGRFRKRASPPKTTAS